MPKTAKLFNNGGSQAVRLPVEFRFPGEEVYIWRNERTGDVVLSAQPPRNWDDFVALRKQLDAVPDDFLADRQQSIEDRDPLAGSR